MTKGVVINGTWKTRAKLESPSQRVHHDFIPNHKHHLYIAQSCPFSHSTILTAKLLGISEEQLSYSYVETSYGPEGWCFSERKPDPVNHFDHLHQVYITAEPNYTGTVNVPILFDVDDRKIVSNDSWEIMEIIASKYERKFDRTLFRTSPEFQSLKNSIMNNINSGVYKAAFSENQQDYEKEFDSFFSTLDALNEHNQFNLNDITALDIRLFVSLIRFDSVYYSLFKLNKFPLSHFTNLWNFVCDFLQLPGVSDTVNLQEIKESYWKNFDMLNPSGIVPKGPELSYKKIRKRDTL